MDEDQDSRVEEVAPHDQEAEAVETDVSPDNSLESAPTSEVATEQPEEEAKQERNWKEVRRKQREAEYKLQAQEEMIEKLLAATKTTPVHQAPEEPDEFANIDPDDIPTWGQADRRIEKKAEAIAEKKYREFRAQEEQSRFLEHLKSEFSDFSDVVNPDSIAILEEKQPKLAATIAELKDPYKMGLQTYHYLKAMDLSGDVSKKRHAKEAAKKMEKNENAVQSPQAFNKRPMAQAFHVTEAEKTKLYDEMMGYSRLSGGQY
jgi:hypothetical protein